MDTASRRLPSIFSVNLLFLITLVLSIVIGSILQTRNLMWGLIASELLLILLPAIVFLQLRHIPLGEGLRLKPVRPLVLVLSLLLGFAASLVFVVIDSVMVQVTHMPVLALPAETMPKGVYESIGLFLAMAVLAPVCEESLYRGVIQGTYESQRPIRFAINTTAILFALAHLEVSGLLSLFLAAYLLGFLAWRSGSIYASILMHIGLNAPVAATALLPGGLGFLGLPAALVGLLATAALTFAIWRLQPVEARPAPSGKPAPRSWLWNYWPVVIAGLLFLGFAGLTIKNSTITLSQAGYNTVKIEQVLESRFRITSQAGEPLGELTCTLTPQGSDLRLDCAGDVSAYDANAGTARVSDQAHTLTWSATWSTTTMELLALNYERAYADPASDFRATMQDGRLAVEDAAGTQTLQASPDDLVAYEWAWRTNALKGQMVRSIRAPFVYLSLPDDQEGGSGPVLKDEILHLYSAEPLDLPAGPVKAQKSTLGGQTAWYVPGHAGPVRLDDGVLVYELEQ